MLSFKQFVEAASYKAREGESEVVHRVSVGKSGKIHAFAHFGTKDAARTFGVGWSDDPEVQKPNKSFSGRIKLGNVIDVPDHGDNHNAWNLTKQLHKFGHISDKERDSLFKTYDKISNHESKNDKFNNIFHYDNYLHNHVLAKHLRKKGIHTIRYVNSSEDRGSTSYMITHPSQFRVLKKSDNPKLNVSRGEAIRKRDYGN